MYVDFDYYENTYGGSLVTSSDFTKYELKARIVMNNYTLKEKLTIKLLEGSKYVDNIKVAMCELIDNLKKTDTLLIETESNDLIVAKGIKSESVKDHTVSFGDKLTSDIIKEQSDRNAFSIMRQYLFITGLLYRGL